MAAMKGLFITPDFTYEPGMVVAEGDLVMPHGRYTGLGPNAMIGVDILRLASANPMFANPQK